MNALVKDWLSGFLMRHQARFPGDWPRDDIEVIEFRKLWHSALLRNEVREDEADAASERLGEAPPTWRRDHIPALIAAVKVIRAERGAGAGEAETRDSARLNSRDCPHCSGEGLTVVWHPRPDVARANGVPATVAAYCCCRHGRWIERNHRLGRETTDVARRTVNLAAVLDGRSGWQVDNPTLDPGYRSPPS